MEHVNILPVHLDLIPAPDPILGTDMPPAQPPRGQLRDRIIRMRDPEVAAPVLVRDEPAHHFHADPRCTVGVEVCIGPLVPDIGGGDGGDGAPETVTRDDDSIAGVRGLREGERVQHARLGFLPRDVESPVDAAGAADGGGVDGPEGEVGDPVPDRGGTAEGEDDELAGGVDGEIAGYVRDEGAF